MNDTPQTSPATEEFVIGPGGRRRRDHVHLARKGSADTHMSRLALAPGGYRPRGLIHLTNRVVTTLTRPDRPSVPPTPIPVPGPPDAANWITDAGWLNQSGSPIRSLLSTWVVPPAPVTQGSQLLYLFNGIEPADGSTIVQPVLQWGDSGADEDGINRTGPFWTAGSWVVPDADGHVYHTPHVRVNPGDRLIGSVTLVSETDPGFTYTCEFLGLAGTKLQTQSLPELVWCIHTLEAYELAGNETPPYDLNSASEYPDAASTAFVGVRIVTDTPNPPGSWVPRNTVSSFGEQTLVPNNSGNGGEIDIYYRPIPVS